MGVPTLVFWLQSMPCFLPIYRIYIELYKDCEINQYHFIQEIRQ